MKISVGKIEISALKIFCASLLTLTLLSISLKFIRGYNLAIADYQLAVLRKANGLAALEFSDCFWFYNHPSIFTLFSIFIFICSLAIIKFSKTISITVFSFLTFLLSFLQATYLSNWFANFSGIEWHISLIQSDLFDFILYILFIITILLQIKILFHFVKANYQAKISLK